MGNNVTTNRVYMKMLKIPAIILCAMTLLIATSCSNNDGQTSNPVVQTGETENTVSIGEEVKSAETAEPKDSKETDDGVLKAEIDLNTTYQEMIGFGAGYTWYSDWALKQPDKKEEIADLLFKDAKMTILRFKNEYLYNGKEVSENPREKQFYELAKERANEYGEDVTVLMSCWSPPAELKSNDVTAGFGTLKKNADGTYMYDEYGQWWAEAVEAYTNAGVKIDYVSIQNECDYKAEWDGMELAPVETEEEAEYAKAYMSVYNAMQEKLGENAPPMIGPETMSCSTMTLKMYMKDIIEKIPEAVAGIGFHLYVGGTSEESQDGSSNEPDSFNQNFRETYIDLGQYPLWQTEFFRGTPLQTAALINNALVNGNLSAYVFWGGIWDGNPPQAKNDIINVNYAGDYAYGSVYWVMRHYSEFIRPGYLRVNVKYPYNGGFKVAAFKSPDGEKLAAVFVNRSAEDIEVSLPVDGYSIENSVVYQTVLENDAYDEGDYYKNIGGLSEGNKVLLKSNSITTVDITGRLS